MEPKIEEVASRIRSLREDLDISMQEMAQATGRSLSEYAAQESGEQDLSFTFLSKCAKRFGVDVVELLTGENPHLTGYSLIREGDGLSVKRRAGFEYLHKAPQFKNKLAEPFLVTMPYLPEEQDKPIHLSYHRGQEIDCLRRPRRGTRPRRRAYVRFGSRAWHDRHRRRAVRVLRDRFEAAGYRDYVGAPGLALGCATLRYLRDFTGELPCLH